MATKAAKVPTGVRFFIDLLQTDELVALYKHFSGVKQIRFPDRQAAEERCINVCFSQPHFKMIEAFKQIGLPEGTWSQYATQLRGPLAAPQGPIKPEDLRRHQKALAADKKKPGWRDTDTTDKPLDTVTLSILRTIRELLPEEMKEGEPPQVNSTDIAKKLNTNVNAICAAADKLSKRELIKVEDDSNPEHKFYWIELLPAGREFNLEAPPVVQKKLPAAGPGPRSGYSGKFIFKLVDKNPRREGTHGFKGFEIYEDGMPYEKFRDKGGRNNDLQWDIDKKFIELRTSTEGGPSVKRQPEAPKAPAKPPTTKKENVKAELERLKAELAAQEAKPTGAVPNGNGRAVPKGSSSTGSKRSVAPRGGKVLRKSKPVRQRAK